MRARTRRLMAASNQIVDDNIDSYLDKVAALFHCDGANGSTVITDEVGNAFSVVGPAAISTSDSVFGGSSLYFPAQNSRVSRQSAFYIPGGSEDFTVELFAKLNNLNSRQGLWSLTDIGSNTTPRIECQVETNGIYRYYMGDGNDLQVPSAAGTIAPGTWYYLAMTRSGDFWRLFVDGQMVAEVEQHKTDGVSDAGGGSLSLGYCRYSGDNFLNDGYIDEFRYTKGVARYVSDFSPPTQPFINP